MGIGVEIDLADALLAERRIPEAIAVLSKVISKRPRESRALHMLGVAHALSGRPREAEDYLRQARTLKPQSAPIMTDLAALFTSAKRDREALPLLEAARKRDPGLVMAQFYYGIALSNLQRKREALEVFERLAAADPFNVIYQQNCAALLAAVDRFDEADAAADRLLARHPTMPEALLVKTVAATGRGELAQALALSNRILARDRNFTKATVQRGYIHLLAGQFSAGWPDYEARFARDYVAPPLNDVPHWSGEPLDGRSVLVYAEQGFGDTLMMSRYLPLLVERGAEVLFLVRRSIVAILQGVAANVQFVDAAPVDRRIDFQIGELSLPYRFGTDLATIPAQTPYLFADTDRVASWKPLIGEHGFRVGVAWRGRFDDTRSIPLRAFFPLSQIPGVRLISLQKHDGVDQLADLPPGMSVETLGDAFDGGPDAFVDCAAVMQNLDMIITLDTSIAHLAGALRRPTWVALNSAPEWRWMVERPDSPWYPDMKLFRQTAAGNWPDVFERMAHELRTDELRRARS